MAVTTKTSSGRLFEDFSIGQHLVHAVPRTLHGGDISTYISLTGDRHPLAASTELARSLGFQREVIPDLLVFHIVFGKSVADVSHNATANLGYADVRFLRPVYPGDTLVAESEVVGLRDVSSGEAGVVYVRTRGMNQKGQEVLSFVRWVMIPRRHRIATGQGINQVPVLPPVVTPDRLPVPEVMNLERFADLAWAMPPGAPWDDYEPGERIDHPDAMTVEEADHVQATRLYHNTAQVHFDQVAMTGSRFGRRLVYGGHVISMAMALAQNGLGTALRIAAWNGGAHVAPTFGGDTLRAFTEVVDKAELARRDVGALRLRMCAVKNVTADELPSVPALVSGHKEPRVVLELDYWALLPRTGTVSKL